LEGLEVSWFSLQKISDGVGNITRIDSRTKRTPNFPHICVGEGGYQMFQARKRQVDHIAEWQTPFAECNNNMLQSTAALYKEASFQGQSSAFTLLFVCLP